MTKPEPLTYHDDEGQKALVAAEITFYLTQLDQAEGLADAYASARVHLDPHVRWYRTETMKRPRAVTPAVHEYLSTWFKPGAKRRAEYELDLTSGANGDLVEPWGFMFGVEPPLIPDVAGFFSVSLPRAFMENDPAGFIAFALELADRVPFRSGQAGYGVQYDEGEFDDDRDAQIGAWCKRYRCVDYRDFAASGEFLGHAIKGVGWLTFLDAAFVAELGGADALKQALPPEAYVHERRHGLVIQAGDAPILGDRNRREDIGVYQRIFEAVRPVVTDDDLAFPGFEDDESVEWINRFA